MVPKRRSAGARAGGVIPQRWEPERYRRNAAFVPALGEPALEWLAPRPGERILDLGCGDGALTVRLAQRCTTVGIDASAEQIAAARKRGLTAVIADGAALPFAAAFDAVFSNAALHWMRPPDAVIEGVWRALKSGGRFVAEMGGAGNIAMLVAAIESVLARRGIAAQKLNPWYFPSPEEYRAKLESRGFSVMRMIHYPRSTPLPGPLADWLDTFAENYLARVPDEARAAVNGEIEAAARDRLYDAAQGWSVDYVRLRFVAVKP